MHYNGGGLPFPADSLINGNWISDPMNAQLPVPQKQVFAQYPQVQWVLGFTAALLVTALQDKSRGGPVSTFAYNLFSSNGYNNQFWLTIVDEASDFALAQLQASPQHNAQQVVAGAVNFYSDYAAAACVLKWPDLQRWLQPDQLARCQQAINQWHAANGHQAAAPIPSNTANYATANVGAGITTPSASSFAYNVQPLEASSKYGGRPKVKPDARRLQGEPTDDLKDLGVTEVDSIGKQQQPTPTQLQQPAMASAGGAAPVVRRRPRPTPLAAEAIVVTDNAGQPIQPNIQPQQAERPPQDIPREAPQEFLPMDQGIPSLDVLGVDESEWGEIPASHTGGAAAVVDNDTPADDYAIHTSGRFLIRPKHNDVVLPSTLEDAQLEEEDDLEIIQISSLPVEGDYSALELEDGNVAVVVAHDDTGRTWTVAQPHNFPYSPLTHIRYLVHVDDDLKYEAFMPRDPDVEYEDLEFDAAKRISARQLRLSDKTILADLSVITEIVPAGAPYTLIGATEDLVRASQSADQGAALEAVERFQGKLTWFEGTLEETALHKALYRVDSFFDQVKARNAVIVAYASDTVSFVAHGMGTKIKELNTAQHNQRLAKLLLFVRDLETVVPRAFVYLNDWMTREVNRVLQYETGLAEYTVTDFAQDYFDLIEMVEAEKGELAAEKIGTVLNGVAHGLTIAYTGIDLMVTHAYSVVGLPVGLASFKLETASGEAFVVNSTWGPELNALLDEAKKDEARPLNIKTYLSGRDGEVFEVRESAWDDGYKMLVRVK